MPAQLALIAEVAPLRLDDDGRSRREAEEAPQLGSHFAVERPEPERRVVTWVVDTEVPQLSQCALRRRVARGGRLHVVREERKTARRPRRLVRLGEDRVLDTTEPALELEHERGGLMVGVLVADVVELREVLVRDDRHPSLELVRLARRNEAGLAGAARAIVVPVEWVTRSAAVSADVVETELPFLLAQHGERAARRAEDDAERHRQ